MSEGLAFFNSLSGSLDIELSEKPKQIAPNLLNEAAPPGATIVRMALRLEAWTDDEEDLRPLTSAEWGEIVIEAASIRLLGEGADEPTEHQAPNGKHFTVRDMAAAIVAAERASRGKSDWFGGIDCHHVFFEGIDEEAGVWCVRWGS